MEKFDFKKNFKQYYSPSGKEFSIVDVPTWNFLKVDGVGNPNTSQSFKDAVETLYPVAYAIKFHCKKNLEKDYSVMPLEGLWWAEDMNDYLAHNKDNWKWTVMIMQPEFVTRDIYTIALELCKHKGKGLPSLSSLRLESYSEGVSSQILYTGAYAEESETIKELHSFIEQNGYQRTGLHHEIYLNDARRVTPEKLKTIIRQPMSK